ncbi:MAG: hypothetical protein K6F00_10615 [Lachnospiraceae bacterium]|nr:hypothetical protein [Lachnospiraceae bacterium]
MYRKGLKAPDTREYSDKELDNASVPDRQSVCGRMLYERLKEERICNIRIFAFWLAIAACCFIYCSIWFEMISTYMATVEIHVAIFITMMAKINECIVVEIMAAAK